MMESRLLVVFNNVNEWLRFAEAKNAMIIALNGVIVFGVARLFKIDEIKESEILCWYFTLYFLCLGASTLVALLSFIPQLKQLTPTFNFKSQNDDFLYFACLKDKTVAEVTEVYRDNDEVISVYHKHLANQIITNAGITKRKYDYFTFACWLTISAILTPILALVYAGYTYKNR
ncbi:Pycsar system effector family protein [Winogradskyella undariae]|uniref:Pycsar system effector family protein n=1 Tax=Winogradskyella undariae TaxID=1285465 RepID=UPI0015CB6BD6|nr:Pycsar system effector family protein [Winogradskyella undariae]